MARYDPEEQTWYAEIRAPEWPRPFHTGRFCEVTMTYRGRRLPLVVVDGQVADVETAQLVRGLLGGPPERQVRRELVVRKERRAA